MAFPIALIALGLGAGAYFLLTPSKKQTAAGSTQPGTAPAGVPVVVPSTALPTPAGGVPADQTAGGAPTVVVTPPAGAQPQTVQQQTTQALPQLLSQIQQSLPQLFPGMQPQASQSPGLPQPTGATPVASPGQSTVPTVPPVQPSTVPTVPPVQPTQPPTTVTIPGPGQPTVPPVVTPSTPSATPASTTPAATTPSLPQVVTNVLTQAQQALPAILAPASSTATPVQTTETHPDIDTNGSVSLAKMMIDREQSSGWKSDLQGDIKAWQARVGLTADGKFGPGGALKMAQDVGILPLVRYWPKSSQQNVAVPQYQAQLRQIADSVQAANPAHAAALRLSAAFEQGQTYGTDNPPAVTAQARQWQADQLEASLSK